MAVVHDGTVRRRVLVDGQVQGVMFRAGTREEAHRAGVAGWVRNLPDGRVEAVLEGEVGAVERVLAWLGTGPARARVTGVSVQVEDPQGEEGFRVR